MKSVPATQPPHKKHSYGLTTKPTLRSNVFLPRPDAQGQRFLAHASQPGIFVHSFVVHYVARLLADASAGK